MFLFWRYKDFPGYSAPNALACAAIQFEYDAISKNVTCLSVGNAKTSDKSFADQRMENSKPKELIIRDLGYYSIGSYEKFKTRKGFI